MSIMETMERKQPRARRSFTPEFKAEIVELCQQGDRSIGQVARDFDLTETAVREWVRQAERDSGTRSDGRLTSAERQELAALRRENRQLREDLGGCWSVSGSSMSCRAGRLRVLSSDPEDVVVTLGRQLRRPELPAVGARWCEAALPEGSVYRFLARERGRLFPPELFADLFQPTGRRSVPPSILAVVMVLQRLEGLSDREAADRYAFDTRWRYAAGVADAVAGEETASFAHTVLVDLRARLRRSADPDRIFRVTCQLARQVGLVGVKRVLDSAPLEDAVTTQDTVTMLRGAIRGLLRACPPEPEAKVRGLLQREDDYRAPGKPACDWQDRAAREALVDALVRDAYRATTPCGASGWTHEWSRRQR